MSKKIQLDSLLLVSLFVATCLGIILMNSDSPLFTLQSSSFYGQPKAHSSR